MKISEIQEKINAWREAQDRANVLLAAGAGLGMINGDLVVGEDSFSRYDRMTVAEQTELRLYSGEKPTQRVLELALKLAGAPSLAEQAAARLNDSPEAREAAKKRMGITSWE